MPGRARQQIFAILQSPLFGAGLTVFTVFLGPYAASWLGRFAQWHATGAAVGSGAVVPVLIFGVFALIWTGRTYAIDLQRKSDHGALRGLVLELAELSKTMPAGRYMQQLSALYAAADQSSRKPNANLREVIRDCLGAIAALAAFFDGDSKRVFSANAMLFLTPSQAIELGWDRAKISFKEPDVPVTSLQGVLVLPKEFTVQLADDGLHVDPDVEELVLPVPAHKGNENAWRVLPGAPFAYVQQNIEHFLHPATQLVEWCKKYSQISPDVRQAIGAHFKSSQIAGMLACPLVADREPACPFVLNIHWREAYRLEQMEAAILFLESLQPLRVLLESCLERRLAAGLPKPSPQPAAIPKPAPALGTSRR